MNNYNMGNTGTNNYNMGYTGMSNNNMGYTGMSNNNMGYTSSSSFPQREDNNYNSTYKRNQDFEDDFK